MGTKESNDNVVSCIDNKGQLIVLKQGDFKKIKNFDPPDNLLEYIGADSSDVIRFETKANCKTYWFKDNGTQKGYAFVMDEKDNIFSGAIIEYNGSYSKTGVIFKSDNESSYAIKYNGSDFDKDKIKTFLKEQIDHKSVCFNTGLPGSDFLEAIDAIKKVNLKLSNGYINPSILSTKGSRELG